MSGQQHAPAALYPRERPGTHFTGGWGGGQGRSERAENLVPTGIRSRTVQPVAQLLYRLSYPTHANISTLPIIQVKISDILYQYNEYKLFVKNISFRSYYKHVLVSLCSQVVETCI